MRTVERPPLSVWMPYRLFGRRLPERHLAWAEHDIRSPWWPWLSSAPIPMGITVVLVVARMLTDSTNRTPMAWYVGAIVIGLGISIGVQWWPRVRRMLDRRRELALRYQRGEITKDEWTRIQHGELTWRTMALALGGGVLVFVVLFVLDHL